MKCKRCHQDVSSKPSKTSLRNNLFILACLNEGTEDFTQYQKDLVAGVLCEDCFLHLDDTCINILSH